MIPKKIVRFTIVFILLLIDPHAIVDLRMKKVGNVHIKYEFLISLPMSTRKHFIFQLVVKNNSNINVQF